MPSAPPKLHPTLFIHILTCFPCQTTKLQGKSLLSLPAHCSAFYSCSITMSWMDGWMDEQVDRWTEGSMKKEQLGHILATARGQHPTTKSPHPGWAGKLELLRPHSRPGTHAGGQPTEERQHLRSPWEPWEQFRVGSSHRCRPSTYPACRCPA